MRSGESEAERSQRDSPRKELRAGAWVEYLPGWLSEADADHAMEVLSQELEWEQRPILVFGREIMQPRLNAWAGELAYKYSGQTLEPRPWHPMLTDLLQRVNAATGASFNHALLNLYRDGRDKIAMHADNEPELGKDPFIAALSFGATRDFVLSYKRKRRRKHTIALGHGSLFLMGGTIQHTWRHALPGRQECKEPRINLTFRRLLGPPGWRSFREGGD
jgi:alkylated DNA repair dioxygenase AlkB